MDGNEGAARRPRVLGVGGTVRPGSTTELALIHSLRAAEAAGAETRLLGGEFLLRLPIYDPRLSEPTEAQLELAEAVRAADAVIVASPGYHGSISGVVKNALDTLEITARDPAPYLTGKAVGAIVTANGWQATGSTLAALRAIIHALRGWPTPYGAGLNASGGLFSGDGALVDPRDAWALATVAEQAVEFAKMRVRT